MAVVIVSFPGFYGNNAQVKNQSTDHIQHHGEFQLGSLES